MSVDPGTVNIIGIIGLVVSIGTLIHKSIWVGKVVGQINTRLNNIESQQTRCADRGEECRKKRVEVEEGLQDKITQNATGLARLSGRMNGHHP